MPRVSQQFRRVLIFYGPLRNPWLDSCWRGLLWSCVHLIFSALYLFCIWEKSWKGRRGLRWLLHFFPTWCQSCLQINKVAKRPNHVQPSKGPILGPRGPHNWLNQQSGRKPCLCTFCNRKLSTKCETPCPLNSWVQKKIFSLLLLWKSLAAACRESAYGY